jgi:small-conductance mechanosensitive channel
MSPRGFTLGTSSNPFLQAVYFVVGGIVLIGALLMGAIVLAFVFALALIVGIVVWIRVWWLRRKILKGAAGGGRAGQRAGSGEIIEVEYTVIDERPREPGRDRRD